MKSPINYTRKMASDKHQFRYLWDDYRFERQYAKHIKQLKNKFKGVHYDSTSKNLSM